MEKTCVPTGTGGYGRNGGNRCTAETHGALRWWIELPLDDRDGVESGMQISADHSGTAAPHIVYVSDIEFLNYVASRTHLMGLRFSHCQKMRSCYSN